MACAYCLLLLGTGLATALLAYAVAGALALLGCAAVLAATSTRRSRSAFQTVAHAGP